MTQDTNTTSGAADLRAEVAMIDAAMVEMTNITPPLKRSECARLLRAALAAGQATAAQQGVAYAALPEPDSYLFQHEDTGLTQYVDSQQVDWGFEKNNPRWKRCNGAFSASQMRAFADATCALRPPHGQAPAQSEVVPECHYGPLRDADAEWGKQLSVYATLPRAADTQQAPAQPAPAYKDSTPELHIGGSAFESWYSSYNPTHKGDKQRARDAYAAGMGDPLVMAAPAAVAGPARQALIDVIAQGLSGTWHCLRVWSAWNVGTMSQDDFAPVDESDTPAELADAVLALLAATPTALRDSQPAPLREGEWINDAGRIKWLLWRVQDLEAKLAARAPADSVTAPAGGETYHLGACIVEDMLHATVMRKEPGRAGAVTVLLTEQIPVEHLQDCDVIVDAAPHTQTGSQPAPDEIINMAREQGLPETETEGVFIVNADDLGRIFAACRAAQEGK